MSKAGLPIEAIAADIARDWWRAVQRWAGDLAAAALLLLMLAIGLAQNARAWIGRKAGAAGALVVTMAWLLCIALPGHLWREARAWWRRVRRV